VQQPAARTIYTPAPYRDVLLKIYAGLGVTASIAAPSAVAASESRAGIKVNDRGYGAIHFERIGANVAIERRCATCGGWAQAPCNSPH